jgi:hypothetical protein|tara:strand:- start:509 stop:988 length:480 start_codon:yes stop_codon:yes gene_type:complete
MALKADRYEESTDISFFYNEGTATRGGAVVLDAAVASGAAMDQGGNKVKYGTAGVPVGILLNDVVNKDLTRTHLNQHKDEVQKGGKVTVLTRGWVLTDMIENSIDPAAGEIAYISASEAGDLTNVAPGSSGSLAIGRFMSQKDADGYAKVYVNLPGIVA